MADLRERGHAETGLDLVDLALRVLERHRARPDLGSWTDLPDPRESALLAGETGTLLVAFRLAPTHELAEVLDTRYALLAAFVRTGDERWLERARRFAVHALAQVRRQRATRGRGRYSLFTGDPGVALYLASCLDARAAYPVLDA